MEISILDKIKKIQSLTGNNTSEAEAMAAAAKVQELLLRHNLSMADLEDHELPGAKEAYGKTDYAIPNANKLTLTWKSLLYNGLAKENFCYVVYHPWTTRISIIGKPSNVQAVCYMAETLVSQIERLALEASRSVFDSRAKYQRDFCCGAMRRILLRLREEKQQAIVASDCTALIQRTGKELKQAVSSFFPSLITRTPGGLVGAGYHDGYRAGAGVMISRGGLGGCSQRQLG